MKTTSEQIIDTATTLLQKQGFNAFSYNDISSSIGIKTASIHYHFPTKSDLGKAVMSRYRNMHKTALIDIDNSISDPLNKLQAFSNLFTCTLGDDFRMCPCGMLSSDISEIPESIKLEVMGFYIDSETWLAAVLKEGLKQGVFSFDSSSIECARCTFASFEGAMLSARAFQDKKRLTKSLKHIINMLQA